MEPKSKIKRLITQRKKYFSPDGDTLDESKIDELAGKIEQSIKDNFTDLASDFILDSLTHLGCCPQLIYDDNGHWAVVEDINCPVPLEEGEYVDNIYIVIKDKNSWQDTIRKAVKYYIFSYEQ